MGQRRQRVLPFQVLAQGATADCEENVVYGGAGPMRHPLHRRHRKFTDDDFTTGIDIGVEQRSGGRKRQRWRIPGTQQHIKTHARQQFGHLG